MQKFFAFFKNMITFFRSSGDDERSRMEKLRDQYRLVLMNEETFEEVSSLRLSPLSVYIFFSSLFVGTAFFVVLLIVYTPLKQYIPGYGDYNKEAEIKKLTERVRQLEEEVEANQLYTDNFRRMLTGDVEDITKEAVEKQGEELEIPDTLAPIKIERSEEDEALREAVDAGTVTGEPVVLTAGNDGAYSKDLSFTHLILIPPVKGQIMAAFDPDKKHYGIDIAAPRNTAIKAAAEGVVISAGYTVETGHSIAIQHPNNVVTIYKHNSVLLKKAGSIVKAGEAIAIIGNSGELTTGPHLHFEFWHRGIAMNPVDHFHFD